MAFLAQLVTWGTNNAAPDTMRAVVTAAIPGIGAIGAVTRFVLPRLLCPRLTDFLSQRMDLRPI